MKKTINTSRSQMMRNYLFGYITQRHACYKIVHKTSDFNCYLDYKKFGAVEKLKEYGVSRKMASLIVKVAPSMERTLSVLMCLWMLLKYSIGYMCSKRVNYQGMRFYFKLNYQETRVINMFGSAGYSLGDITLIDIPEQYTIYKKMPIVPVFSGISYLQLLKSFVYAIRITYFMKNKYGKEDMLFRSYSSFPYFLGSFFVSNLDKSNELVFVNHYDRWMYLFGNCHLHRTYVQHGKLWKDHIKRISCDTAYYISKSQQDVLEYTLFNNKPEARFRKPFDYSGIDKLKGNGQKDFLIICLNVFAEEQESALSYLYEKKVNVYLKPHPGDNADIYNDLKGKYPGIIILDKFDYPKVDYVISYDSTLADEYEMHGIPVLLYSDSKYKETINEWVK